MVLSAINRKEYIRRSALEIETAKRVQHSKKLEVLLLENLKGIANCDYYRDSQHNVVDYVIFLNSKMDYKMFNE